MSKRFIMSLLFSVVISIVTYFGMPHGGKKGEGTVIVSLPAGCLLTSPKNDVESMTGVVAVVRTKPGKVEFDFDCEGTPVSMTHEVVEGEQTWKPEIP